MKTYKDHIMEKEMILFRVALLNHDSLRIYLDTKNLAESNENNFREFKREADHLNHSLKLVGQSILNMIHGSERSASVFFQVKDEVLSNLHQIKSNLDRIVEFIDTKSSLYN